ncbi:type IV secretory system conjugative DNA transfer family protein [Azohydromonas lata]|uniref:type IV secretory system conjugative DNA transfer family protein n=1 Tax=Azohydromonas lata TaxID=45677 RepID=UPI000835554D|nr:type IV secretory system conjugative DNA transfer family protein [Azohydromonas lata]
MSQATENQVVAASTVAPKQYLNIALLCGLVTGVAVIAGAWAGGTSSTSLAWGILGVLVAEVLVWLGGQLVMACKAGETERERALGLLAKGTVGLLLAVLLTIAGLWLSAMIFLAANKTNPTRAQWNSLPGYWDRYGDDERHKRQLLLSMALAFGLAYVAVPLALYKGAQRKRALYGEARFANEGEVRKAKLLDGQGIILGKYQRRYLTLPGQQYVLLAAPPRSGKDVSVAKPNLYNWDGSAVVLDIKGDLRDSTSGFRAKHGQAVYVFAPFDTGGCSHRYNPLGYVRTEAQWRVKDLLKIAQIIFPNDDSKSADAGNFFADQANNLFLALGLYLLETPNLPRTIGQMLRITSSDGRPIREYLTEIINKRERSDSPLSYDCVAAFSRFLANTAETTLTGIVSTFTGPLKAFADPVTDAATSSNDFDLADLRKKRMTVYLVMPFDELAPAKLLLNLFITQMISANVQELPEQNKALKYQCLVLLNEFTAAGRIDVIARGIGFMPQYNLRLLIIVQSMAQLAATYGKETAQAIATACACQILFAPKEQSDAELYSRMLGTYTERRTSRGRSYSSGKGGGSSSTSSNESEQSRPLMLPQEVKELGADNEIIIYEGVKPILAQKARWYEDPEMKLRAIDPIAVQPLNLDLHIARTDMRHRPAKPEDGRLGDMPIERIAIDTHGLTPPAADTPPEEAEKFLGAFFGRMDQPQDEAAPAEVEPPKPPRPKAEPNAIGVDIKVGNDGTVHMVAKSVKPKRTQPPAESDGQEASPKTTLGKEIEVDGDGVITFKKKPGKRRPAADEKAQADKPQAEGAPSEPNGVAQELDLRVLRNTPSREENGRER